MNDRQIPEADTDFCKKSELWGSSDSNGRKDFLKLPKSQRDSIMQKQAQTLEEYYSKTSDWDGAGTEFGERSDTPETDDAQFGTGRVSVDFARRLERERDEARDRAERYRLEANAMMMQRDEAREALEYIAHSGLSARFLEDYAREFLKSRGGTK